MWPTMVSEPGTCELARAVGGVDPFRAVSLLLEVLSLHEEWTQAIHLLLELADDAGRVGGLEKYARLALRWNGEDFFAFRDRWYRYRRLLPTPSIRALVSMANVRRLFDAYPAHSAAIAELALETAETALGQADLFLAQEALTLVFANVTAGDGFSQDVRSLAGVLEQRLAVVVAETNPVRSASEEYVRNLYRSLQPWTKGKKLVILGGSMHPAYVAKWEAELDVEVRWFDSTNVNPVDEPWLRALDPYNLIVVALYKHMSHLRDNTKQWLKRHDVPLVQVEGTGGMVLEGLRNELAAREARSLHNGARVTSR